LRYSLGRFVVNLVVWTIFGAVAVLVAVAAVALSMLWT
jgi:hypothetical protein